MAAAHKQVRRLGGHGTTALQYQARRLARTLSGSIKGPKRVPLSFREVPRRSRPWTFAQTIGPQSVRKVQCVDFQAGIVVVKARDEALEVVLDGESVL